MVEPASRRAAFQLTSVAEDTQSASGAQNVTVPPVGELNGGQHVLANTRHDASDSQHN